MDQKGQMAFGSMVSRISMIGYQCILDIVFDIERLSTKVKRTMLEDIKRIARIITRIKTNPSQVKIPRLGRVGNG